MPRTWDMVLEVEQEERVPVYRRVARAVREAIRSGRLRPGDVLPGSRTLASQLGVHRNTLLAALDELSAEGWLVTRAGAGTFVALALPEPATGADPSQPAGLGFPVTFRELPLPHPPARPGVLAFASGTPDARLIPDGELVRAYRRALRLHGRTLLDYGDPQGHPRLREQLAGMLAAWRGLSVGPEHLIVTRGSQMALDLVARTLLKPGDVVAVEELGYRPAWAALELAGARLVPLPVDAGGVRPEALEALCARETVRAVYVTPHHQYPTTVTLSPARRLALLAIARRHSLAVIEDDYDHEFHFEGPPLLPLASMDPTGQVVYLGTLSKILAPGIRLGYVATAPALATQLARLRRVADRQGDLVMECAVAELFEDGVLQRHVRRMARVSRGRRDALAEALVETFGDRLSFDLPAGGMAIWAHRTDGQGTAAWAERGRREGVTFVPGMHYSLADADLPSMRLGYASMNEEELREAVRRLALADRHP